MRMRAEGRRVSPVIAGRPSFRRNGFTLLEVLVVIVLIAILVTVAVPLLRRSTATANEASAIKSLRVIYLAEIQHRLTYSAYGTMADLGSEQKQLITDPGLIVGVRSGYRFTIVVDSPSTWHAVASPFSYGADGITTYYVDEGGEIRGQDIGTGPLPERDAIRQWRSIN